MNYCESCPSRATCFRECSCLNPPVKLERELPGLPLNDVDPTKITKVEPPKRGRKKVAE